MYPIILMQKQHRIDSNGIYNILSVKAWGQTKNHTTIIAHKF
jgi:hypothetical protein